MRKLLQGSANLEFWETYTLGEVQGALQALDTRLAQLNSGKTTADSTQVDSAKAETKAADTKVKDALASLKGSNAQDKKG